jgi:hypothetical protein
VILGGGLIVLEPDEVAATADLRNRDPIAFLLGLVVLAAVQYADSIGGDHVPK